MKPKMTRIQKCMQAEPSGKSPFGKFRRETPTTRLGMSILMVIGSLVFATLIMYSPKLHEALYSGMVLACGLLCMGVYMIKTLPTYKERFFTPRRFSTPVLPDGSRLEDNTRLLQNQIEKEISTDTPEELKIKVIFAASIFVAITIAAFFDRTAYFYNVWFFSLFFSLFFLRKISSRMAWLADKIAVYFSIFLWCLSLLVFFILQTEDIVGQDYFGVALMLMGTPVFLIYSTTAVQHILRRRIKERTIRCKRRNTIRSKDKS